MDGMSWCLKSSKIRSQLTFSSPSPSRFCTRVARLTLVLAWSVIYIDQGCNYGIAILSSVSAWTLSLLQLENGLCYRANIGHVSLFLYLNSLFIYLLN